jgi:CRP/FNR family cyclic AMP-dependent transcriptional regulator
MLFRAVGRVRAWERGEVLIRQGGRADSVVLIIGGLTKITAESANGYTSVLALRGPGELLGEMSCLDGSKRSATVTAMDRVEGVVVGAEAFRRLLSENGALSVSVLCSVVARLRHSDNSRAGHGAHPAKSRLARVLLDLAGRYGVALDTPAGAIAVNMNQQELAGATGISRESVVRCLRAMQHEGVVSTSRGRTVVLDIEKLREQTDE